MKKKYLYNGQLLDESDVLDAATQSKMDLSSYIQKAGIKAVDDSYSLNGKNYSADDILDAANQSKLGFDDYIQKAGFQKKSQGGNGLSVDANGTLQSSDQQTSTSEAQSPSQEDDFSKQNPIDLAKQSDELGNRTVTTESGGAGGSTMGTTTTQIVPDQDAVAKGQKIDDYLKAQGYDPKQLKDLATNFPDDYYDKLGMTKDQLLQEMKDNPTKAAQHIAVAKWQIPLQEAIQAKDGQQGLVDFQNMRNAFADANTDYLTKRRLAPQILATIRQYAPDSKTEKEWQQNFAEDASNAYGDAQDTDPTFKKEQEQSPNLDVNQIRGLDYLQDVAPEQAQGYSAALIDPKKLDGNYDAQQGQEEKLQRLEQIGLGLKENTIKRNDTSGGSDPIVKSQLQDINDQKNGLLTKYPKAGVNDAEGFAAELLGQKNTGLNWLALKSGEATSNAANSVWDLVSEPFRSDENSKIHQLQTLGDANTSNLETGLTQKNQLEQSFTPTVSKQLQAQIDGIKNDNTLSDDDKRNSVTKLLMQNPGEWQRTPIEGGKTNLGVSSLLYGTGNLAASLAPFVIAETATGGGATASYARKFTSTFAAMMGTSFHEAYADAIKNGEANPYATALRTTAINSAAMAGAQTPEAIKDMLAGTKSAASDLVGKMTDDEILGALRKAPESMNAFGKTLEYAKNAGVKVGESAIEGAKSAAKITPFITAGNVLNDAISGNLKQPEDYAKQAAIEGLKFSILGAGLGTIGKMGEDVNELNKAAIYQAGSDPESFLAAVKQREDNGSISPSDAQQVKDNIEKAQAVFKKVPFVDGKGNPLSEKDRRNLLFLKMQENDLEDNMSKDLPKTLQTKMEQPLSDTQDKIDKLYKGTLIDEPNKTAPQTENQTPVTPTETGTTNEGTDKNSQPSEKREQNTKKVLTANDVETGKEATINFLKNPEKAPVASDDSFAQSVEPAGKFITQKETDFVPKGWQEGTVTLKNPLVIKVDDNSVIDYKRELSKEYDGKTGKALTKALQKDGYDGIITSHKDGHLSEIIVFDPSKSEHPKENIQSPINKDGTTDDRILELAKKDKKAKTFIENRARITGQPEIDVAKEYLQGFQSITGNYENRWEEVKSQGEKSIQSPINKNQNEQVNANSNAEVGSQQTGSNAGSENGGGHPTGQDSGQEGGKESDVENEKTKAGNTGDATKPTAAGGIEVTDAYKTANVGNHEGEKEFAVENGIIDKKQPTDLKKQQVANISKWTVPLDEGMTDKDGNLLTQKGDTMADSVGRVISEWIKDKQNADGKTAILAHSSDLKMISTYEGLKDDPIFKDADWNHPETFTPEQVKAFTDQYNKESTTNGDVVKYKADNGNQMVVARHGQTEDNLTGKFRTDDTQLTEKGREQAHDVGKELKDLGIEKIKSSSLPRAIETSNIAMEEINKNKPNANASEKEPEIISTKKRINLQKAAEFKLPEIPIPKLGTDAEEMQKAKERIDGGKNPKLIVAELLSDKPLEDKKVSVNDRADMQYYMLQLKQRGQDLAVQRATLENEVEEHPENQDAVNKLVDVTQQSANHADDYISAVEANKVGSAIWGKSGNQMQIEMDENGQILQRIQRINDMYGGDVPPVMKEQLDKLKSDLDRSNARLQELQKKADDLNIENAALKAQQAKKESGAPAREKLSKQISDIAKRLRTSSEFDDFLKGPDLGITKSGLDLPTLKNLAAGILEQTAKAVKAGENAIDFITKAVNDLKEDIDKDKFIAALHAMGEKAGIFDIKERPTPEQLNLKRLQKQLDDLQKGIIKDKKPPRVPSDAENNLKEQIKAEKEKLGLLPEKSEKKTAAQINIDRLQKQLEKLQKGEIPEKPEKREPTDEEKNLKKQIEAEKEKLGLSDSQSVKDQRALEKERDRQLQRVNDLKQKIEDLQKGKRTIGRKPEEDTPEIERLKEQVKNEEKELTKREKAANTAMEISEIKTKKQLTPYVLKSFKDNAEIGISKPDEMVDKIHSDLSVHNKNINKQTIREILAGEHRPEKQDITNTPEYRKAQNIRANSLSMLRHFEKSAMDSKKNLYMKSLDFVNKWAQTAIFAFNTNVLAKLSGAAVIGSTVHMPLEFAVGRGVRKLFPNLAKQAPSYGDENLQSLGKWYSNLADPVKFAQETRDELIQGESKLKQELSNHPARNIYKNPATEKGIINKTKAVFGYLKPVLTIYTSMHPIIKNPIIRATFEKSLINVLRWYKKQGMDITHPLVLESARQYAFKQANYEEFQEDSKLAKGISGRINQMENWGMKKALSPNSSLIDKIEGNAAYTASSLYHVLVPVAKVPINITRRLALPLALPTNIIKAYGVDKAVKNLKPEEADLIIKQITKGTIGLAYWTLGVLGNKYLNFGLGGFPTRFDPDKDRGKDLKYNRPKSGEMFGLPESAQHAVYLQALQYGATFANVIEHYKDQLGKGDAEAYKAALMSQASGLASGIPPLKEGVKLGKGIIGADPAFLDSFEKDMAREFGVNKMQDLGILPGDGAGSGGGGGATGGGFYQTQRGEKVPISEDQAKELAEKVADTKAAMMEKLKSSYIYQNANEARKTQLEKSIQERATKEASTNFEKAYPDQFTPENKGEKRENSKESKVLGKMMKGVGQ